MGAEEPSWGELQAEVEQWDGPAAQRFRGLLQVFAARDAEVPGSLQGVLDAMAVWADTDPLARAHFNGGSAEVVAALADLLQADYSLPDAMRQQELA